MDLATIQRRIKLIDDYKKEIKVAKQALKDELDNNEAFVQATADAKQVNIKRKQLKDEIMNQSHCQKLTDDIRVNTEEIATLMEILSAELLDLYQETNSDLITGEDGQLRKFKLSAKIMPAGSDEIPQPQENQA